MQYAVIAQPKSGMCSMVVDVCDTEISAEIVKDEKEVKRPQWDFWVASVEKDGPYDD